MPWYYTVKQSKNTEGKWSYKMASGNDFNCYFSPVFWLCFFNNKLLQIFLLAMKTLKLSYCYCFHLWCMPYSISKKLR